MANFGCFQNVFEANSAPYTERNQIETDANNSISRGEIFFKECEINNHPCEKWSPWRAFHYRWERNDYRTVAKTHQDNEIMNVSRAKLNSCASEFCSSTVRKGDIFRTKSRWKTLYRVSQNSQPCSQLLFRSFRSFRSLKFAGSFSQLSVLSRRVQTW